MIQSYKTIDLFGKMLFEWAVIKPPFRKENPMENEACFLYILHGEYNSISEQEAVRVKKENAVLMKCGNYLSQMFGSKDNQRYEAMAVHFYPEVLLKVYDNELPKFLTAGEKDVSDESMSLINSDEVVAKYIEGVLFYFENPHLVNEEILVLKLKEIILLLNQTKNGPKVRAILSNLFNPTTYSFREVVDSHLYTSMTIPEFAQLTHMSVSTFKREFNKIYNDSPAAYLMKKRIDKAADLLKLDGSRMSDVAFSCGFNNLSHFSKAFKKQMGIAPSIFKMNQTENP